MRAFIYAPALASLLHVWLGTANAVAATLWLEGEAPATQSMHRHPWWFDQVKKDVLSGGDWISNFSPKEGVAEYKVEALEAGDYTFWVRADPVQSKLDYALDGGDWVNIDLNADKRGKQNIAADQKPDLRFIAWSKAGRLKLSAGAHSLKFRMHGSQNNHGGLDCFVLTTDGFVPQGKMKPGEASSAAIGPAEWFPLLVDEDDFRAGSVIDMSGLTEAPAGKFGPVLRKGSALVFANRPSPAKFWGCGANLDVGKHTREQQLRRIRYLRKFGINAVRQHPLFDEVSTQGKVDPKKLDDYDWWFAELKKAGIYSQWSVFYHFPISASDDYPADLFAELEPMGKSGLRDSYGLITISEQLWKIRTPVMLSLLSHKNPYTGLRYAEDPALMAVEFQNEDCVFFWNPLGELANPQPKKWQNHARMLRQAFAAWAKKKYATEDALKTAWGKLNGESLGAELQLMGPWELDTAGIRGRYAGNLRRAGDQIQFLTEMQLGFYQQCEKAIRGTGFRAQTITTNWLAGSGLLDQANILTDQVGSTIDRHNYAGGGVGVHGIAEGGVYADSHLGKPGHYLFGISMKQVEDRPFSMSEWTMCPPNRWKAECAPILAFYGMALQGWDASFHFLQEGTRLGDGWPRMSSYVTDTPHYIGQFPALAFALQKGHFKEAPIVAARRTEPAALFTGQPAWWQDYYNGNDLIKVPNGTPLETFAIGRVVINTQGGKSETADLAEWWNKKDKVLHSATGELLWDYGNQRILVQSPKTQGLIGRAAGYDIKLPDATIMTTTEFVSLLFTPLDDRPLSQSKHLLITAMAQDKQTGATYSPDGTKLTAAGTAPLLLEPVQARISLAGPPIQRVRVLNHYGYPGNADLKLATPTSFQIDGTSRAYYYEVIR